MRFSCSIEIEYQDEGLAEAVLRSIDQDNTSYASARTDGNTLLITVEARTVSSLIHTLEDMLVCVRLTEGILM